MRRKFWAIRELWSCISGYMALFYRAHLTWSVHTDEKTRQERMADLRYQIDGTPLKYEQQKLERRLQRAALALLYPKQDAALMVIRRAIDDLPGDSPLKAMKLYEKIEIAVLKRNIGDL